MRNSCFLQRIRKNSSSSCCANDAACIGVTSTRGTHRGVKVPGGAAGEGGQGGEQGSTLLDELGLQEGVDSS